jgi:hypothetical protein
MSDDPHLVNLFGEEDQESSDQAEVSYDQTSVSDKRTALRRSVSGWRVIAALRGCASGSVC